MHRWFIKPCEVGGRAEFDLGVTLRPPAIQAGPQRMNPMAVTRKEAALASKKARKDKKKAARGVASAAKKA